VLDHSPAPPNRKLAAFLAELRAEAALQAAEAAVRAALSALILATLARLLARLEQMFELWRSGQLPTPAAPGTASAAPVGAHTARPAPSRQQADAGTHLPRHALGAPARAVHAVAPVGGAEPSRRHAPAPYRPSAAPPWQHPIPPAATHASILVTGRSRKIGQQSLASNCA